MGLVPLGLGKAMGVFDNDDAAPFPERYVDPRFTEGQDALFGFGQNALAGEFNDYYKPLGEYGGQELEDMIRMNTRDINRAAMERNAAMGIRSSRGSGDVARAIGDMTTGLRYNDFVRAMGGRQNLLGTGLNTVGSVRDMAKQEMADVNAYNLGKFNYEQAQEAAEDAQIGQLISTGLQLAGTVGGFMMGGPAGAGMGSQLGSAAGSMVNKPVSSPRGFISGTDVDPYMSFGRGL